MLANDGKNMWRNKGSLNFPLNGLVMYSPLWHPEQQGFCESFDGNDYLSNAVANFRSGDSAGAIEIWFRTTTTGAWQTLFSSADVGSATRFIYFLISTSNTIRLQQRNNDADDKIIGTTTVTDGKWHHAVFSSNGTAYSFFLDGAVEEFTVVGGTDSGDWFADTALRDNITVGVIEIDSLLNYFTGAIGWTRVYSREMLQPEALTNSQRGRNAVASDDTGLVFNLPMDEGTGNPVDDVGSLTMTSVGATWIESLSYFDNSAGLWTPMSNFGATWDKYGRTFDGIVDVIKATVAGLPQNNEPVSIEVWYNPANDTESDGWIVHWGALSSDDSYLVVQITKKIRFAFYANDLDTVGDVLTPGTPTHIIATYDGTTRIIYINGGLDNSDTPTPATVSGTNLGIGADNLGTGHFTQGIIGEVRVYNRALTAGEAMRNYQRTKWRYSS